MPTLLLFDPTAVALFGIITSFARTRAFIVPLVGYLNDKSQSLHS
jgi:hypothetical protein